MPPAPSPTLDDLDRLESSRSRAEHRKNLAFACFLLAFPLGGLLAFAVYQVWPNATLAVVGITILANLLIALPLGLIFGLQETSRAKKLAALARDGTLQLSADAPLAPDSCIANIRVTAASEESLSFQRHGGKLILLIENLSLFVLGTALLIGFLAHIFFFGFYSTIAGVISVRNTIFLWILPVAGASMIGQAIRPRAFGWRAESSPPILQVRRLRFLLIEDCRDLPRDRLEHITLTRGDALKVTTDDGHSIHLASLTPRGADAASTLRTTIDPTPGAVPRPAIWRARRIVAALNRVWASEDPIALKGQSIH